MAPTELGPAGNGTRIAVEVGDTVTVRLPERRTAGFRWRREVDEAALALVSDRYEATSTLPGAPGIRVFTFQVLRAGASRIQLVSRRGWQPAAGEDEKYIVDVDVTPSPGG
jgi:predicted secreted protein